MLSEMTESPNHFPLAGNGFSSRQMMDNAVFNLFDKVLQILLQLDGDVFSVKKALVGITQDRYGAVVGSHNDEPIRCVEDVKSGITTADVVGSDPLKVVNAS